MLMFIQIICFHRAHYNAERAYAQSKLAQLMFTKELDKRIKASGENITVNAVHPGVVATELFQHVAWARNFPWLARAFLKVCIMHNFVFCVKLM